MGDTAADPNGVVAGGTWGLARAHLDPALDLIDEVVAGLDAEGIIRYINGAVRMVAGYEPSELIGRPATDILHPDDHGHVIDRLTRWTGRYSTGDGPTVRLRDRQGGWFDVSLETVTGAEIAPFAALVVCKPHKKPDRDASSLPAAATDYETRLARVASAFLHLPTNRIDDGIRSAIAEMGSLEGVDRVSVVLVDVDEEEGREMLQISHDWYAPGIDPVSDGNGYMELIDSALMRAMHRMEVLYVPDVDTLDDSWSAERGFWANRGTLSFVAVPILDEGMLTGFISFEAVTERHVWDSHHIATLRSGAGIIAQALARQAAEQELAHQARHDALTGLGNRWDFLDHLTRAVTGLSRLDAGVATDRGIAVLLFDLDRFKVFNDSLGHTMGDQLLRVVAHRLEGATRKGDAIARLGGDEIVVLCRDLANRDEAVDVARQMQGSLVAPMEIGGHEVFTTTSVGVAYTEVADCTAEDLLRDADAAMYVAKAKGRNRVELFGTELREMVRQRLRSETELKRAVMKRELMVHYQPEVLLSTGRIVGAEALVRWQHPSRGLLSAFEFIDVAEETGMILDVGPWVLEQACTQLAEWQRRFADLEFTMRVNLSTRQLSQPDLVPMIQRVINEAGASPADMCLEITETSLMVDTEASLGVLEQLHGLGVDLAIDDFGTGYSSLSYLKTLPVDIMKIDQSFVDGLGSDPDDTSIVSAIVGLAASLGLGITAEGVETELQRQELMRLGGWKVSR